ncbi:protein of unknown function (plasmid) [Azospirillum baldaniorum]|uniref:Uncharacterized protein n=1 Tax=Azospirillum baldaniorum TaxID=1064539 RepID=A0A9P1K1S5_9PROT|nr:protein of unknown function [Azospirillum baldaniorum]
MEISSHKTKALRSGEETKNIMML